LHGRPLVQDIALRAPELSPCAAYPYQKLVRPLEKGTKITTNSRFHSSTSP
jgi:hypothetical protein